MVTTLPTGTVRLPGWEQRLPQVIEAARHQPYVLGEHDCFRLACAVVQALTGVDLWPPWAGRYRTRRQALRFIAHFAQVGGACTHLHDLTPAAVFTAAASRLFGAAPAPMHQAQRGDICEFHDASGEAHLGVVLGTMVVVMREHGLDFAARHTAAHAWRIG